MEEDPDLKLITSRKMAELMRRAELASKAKEASAKKAPPKSDKETLLAKLYDRGDEVLETAYLYYPRETELVVEKLAEYLRKNPQTEKISGGELYEVLRNIGLRFSLKTSIKVQDKGKFVDLKEKFKLSREEETS